MKSVLAPAFALLVAGLATPGASSEPNRLGLYYDSAATVDEIEITPNSQHNLYLVLVNPVNDSFDGGGVRDVSRINGFECAVDPPTGDYVIGVSFPLPAVNLGSSDNIIAGFAGEVPVTGGARAAVLATLTVMSAGNNAAGWLLGPASPSTLPGAMVYADAEDPDRGYVNMLPSSGAFDQAVFWFGDWHVEEARQWGKVKVLFR